VQRPDSTLCQLISHAGAWEGVNPGQAPVVPATLPSLHKRDAKYKHLKYNFLVFCDFSGSFYGRSDAKKQSRESTRAANMARDPPFQPQEKH